MLGSLRYEDVYLITVIAVNKIITDDSGPSTSKREHDEAYLRVAQGISTYEEDYLDLNLIAETAFMKKYKDLLSKR